MDTEAPDTEAPLPLHLTSLVRAWKCRQRGMCCKVHSIPISETQRRRITRRLVEVGDERAEMLQTGPFEVVDGWLQLPRRDGACVFLEDDLCSLHKRFGANAVPNACAKFPYIMMLTDDRLVASLSFQCPTALELLAHSPGFEILVEPDGDPPTDQVSFLASPGASYFDLAGEPVAPDVFWRLHRQLLAQLMARPEPSPLERLCAFAEAATGLTVPAGIALPADIWRRTSWDMQVTRDLAQATGEPAHELGWWWSQVRPQDYTFAHPAGFDGDAFVMRYLLHRTFAPVFYLHHRDLRFLLAMLFALLVRIRLEEGRGHELTVAVRHTDRFFVHPLHPAELFGTAAQPDQPPGPELPWGNSWRVFAALARSTATPAQ